VSPDQITYVLIAFIVTGIAILLLVVGALLARRGRGEPRSVARPAAAEIAAAPVAPAVLAPAAVVPAPAAAPAPPTAPQLEPEPPFPPPAEPEQVEEAAAVTAADLAAAARRVHDPREEEIIEGFLSISPRRRETAAFEAAREPTAAAPAAPAAVAVAAASAGVAMAAAPVDPYIDDATGLDSRAAWDRVLAEENARYVRYRRPVGVVVAELDGLGRFATQFGAEASHRVLAAVGGALRRNARRTDRVAHVGAGRFLVMLPETDEIQAINYVERVRAECERWLEAGAVALHLSMGWASPNAVGELDTALRTAEERMYAERRRAARAGTGTPDA
jgi:diguanylate cyclase (GGDEF)-like protein